MGLCESSDSFHYSANCDLKSCSGYYNNNVVGTVCGWYVVRMFLVCHVIGMWSVAGW